jgi:hypothetical protein
LGCGGGKEGKVGVRAGRKERVGGAGVERKVGVRVRLGLMAGEFGGVWAMKGGGRERWRGKQGCGESWVGGNSGVEEKRARLSLVWVRMAERK